MFTEALFTTLNAHLQKMDIQNVTDAYNGILLSLKREGNPAMCNNTDERTLRMLC
jgi:hypothetical protein